MNAHAIELENLPDFAQVELWDFYQFLLQKYQQNVVPNEITVNALRAAEKEEYEVVTLDELRQQWDAL